MKTVKMYHMFIQFIGIQPLSTANGKRKKEMIHTEPGTLHTPPLNNYKLQCMHGGRGWVSTGLLVSLTSRMPHTRQSISPVLKVTHSTLFQHGAKTGRAGLPERSVSNMTPSQGTQFSRYFLRVLKFHPYSWTSETDPSFLWKTAPPPLQPCNFGGAANQIPSLLGQKNKHMTFLYPIWPTSVLP